MGSPRPGLGHFSHGLSAREVSREVPVGVQQGPVGVATGRWEMMVLLRFLEAFCENVVFTMCLASFWWQRSVFAKACVFFQQRNPDDFFLTGCLQERFLERFL